MVSIYRNNFYYKSIMFVIAILLLTVALFGCNSSRDHQDSAAPHAVNGVLDLTGYRFDQSGPVQLSGQWRFYWKQLLTPDQLPVQESAGASTRLIDLPGFWNGLNSGEGEIGGSGYATYHLRVELSDTSRLLSIKVPYIRTAYRLWVNGREVADVGTVSSDSEGSVAKYAPKEIQFMNNRHSLDIVIQVSNYEHRLGGIWNPIILGTTEQIDQYYRKSTMIEMLIIGALLAKGVHHIVQFCLRRKEKGSFYFGAFCVLIACRNAFKGQGVIYYFIPDLNWLVAFRIDYICFYLSVTAIVMFVHSLYPQEVSRQVVRYARLAAVLFTVLTFAVPQPWFTYGPPVYQVMTTMTCSYLLFCLGRAVFLGRDGALFALTGAGVYVVTIALDILYYNQLALISDVSTYGVLICIYITSFVLSSKSAKAFLGVETLSRQMREMNVGLEQKIRERTVELERINSSLERVNEDLARMETSRRQLLSNISHDLGTPMTLIQGYVEALIDGVVQEPEQQQKYLKLIFTRITGLNRLISDLFQLSKLEARQLRFDIQPMTTDEFIRYFHERYEFEVLNAGLRFEAKTHALQPQESAQTIVHIDVDRIDQVLTNIIYNAVKHTVQGGLIQLHIIVDGHSLVVQVHDNGSGIDPEDLPFIFDRFYKKDKTRNTASGGSGLGLAIAKEIIDYHGGRIWAQSRVGQGACIAFMLPLAKPDK